MPFKVAAEEEGEEHKKVEEEEEILNKEKDGKVRIIGRRSQNTPRIRFIGFLVLRNRILS